MRNREDMVRGAQIEVFEDPITEERSEGRARLKRDLDCSVELDGGDELQCWDVEFVDDGLVTCRWIRVRHEG